MTPPETKTVDPKLAEREAIKDINQDYKRKFGFNDPETGYVYKAPKGLSRQLVEDISDYKGEPQWMREFRLKALEHFRARPVPQWGANLNQIDFDDIHYFVRASEKAETDWDDVPEDIKNTFDKLGIPEAERKFLAGVGAQYECLAEETLVWTAAGHRPIREVDAGDVVYAFDEERNRLVPAPVKGRAHKGRRPVLRVKVGNREIRATENHPFLTLEYTREDGAQRGRYRRCWKYLRDLEAGDLVAVSKKLPDAGSAQDLSERLGDRDTSPRDREISVPERSTPELMFAGHRVFIGGDVTQLPMRNPRRRERVGKHRFTHRHSSAAGTDFRRHVNEWFGFVRIESIEPDGEAEVYDIEVDGPHNFVAEGLIVHNSEMVYHQVRKDLEEQGVHFLDMDSGLREHEDIVREHFASVIPANDNMLAALNSAVWSGGSFVYVPPGVKVEMPLQAYFRINTENMGQFERTLIIADEGSDVHYIEGCHLAGSMVRVRDGEKPIEEIEAGDEVLTHRGRFRRVREPQRRRFLGPIRHIRFQGEPYRSLAVTPAHPFYAVKRERAREHNKAFTPEWLEARELEKGDYLALPTSIETGSDRDESWGADVAIGRGRHTAVVERVDVTLDPRACRLIGLYLAEGSVPANTSYVNFDSAEVEDEIREFTREAMVEAFGLEPWEYEYEGRAARSLRYSSVRAARFFAQTFGRTTPELRIPDWAFGLGEAERAALVRGFYDGEGSYDTERDLHRISQTNRDLAQRMRELLLSLGIRSSLSCTARPAPRRDIWQLAICKEDHPRFERLVLGQTARPQRADHAHAVIRGDHVWTPIASVDVIEANCQVFNMSVEEDESYVCEGVVSHNCTAPVYSTDSLHSAVVELIARPGARIRYTTLQNWSQNVFNLVTKRAIAQRDATVEWVDCNLGCLTGDSMIGTPDRGPVPIREIRAGDQVYGTDLGEMRPVARRVSATRDNGVQPTFRITTEDFRQLDATANHPFLVLDRARHGRSYAIRWRRLENISVGDYVAVSKGSPDSGRARFLGDYRYTPPSPRSRPRPIELPSETSEELMWLLGVFIGDGGVERSQGRPRRVNFAVPPQDRARPRLVEALADLFGVTGVEKGPATLAVNSSILGDFILWLGLGGNAREKRIPGWVFALPAAQKLAFIEGYLDSDGHERKAKVVDGTQLGQLTWASVNRDLLEDLKRLLIDCGLEPRKISRYEQSRKLPLGAAEKTYVTYYLAINIRDSLEAIRSHRAPRPLVEFVKVASIEPLGSERTYDIEVEGIHNFTANGIVVHNSKVTMKYPSVYLLGERAHGEILSIAFAGHGQHQDAGGKIIHAAPKTTSSIFAKSISKDGGRSTYRGLLEVAKGASEARSKVVCDALLLDPESRSDTYPTIRIDESDANVGHEASVSKIGEEQLYYLQSHGLDEEEASKLIVNGFIEPVVKELPMEYAVELNRLIELQMEGSIG